MKFILIFGPSAVGKMAVGRELVDITGFKLFHNHMSIELILNFFEYGTPKFNLLNMEFRRRIFEEVATSDLEGLVFTYVWAFNEASDKKYVDSICKIFLKEGGLVYFVELEASLEERIKRNRSKSRLEEKPSKRNVQESQKRLLEMDSKYIMNTKDDFYYPENYIKINNTHMTALEVAQKIKEKWKF